MSVINFNFNVLKFKAEDYTIGIVTGKAIDTSI